MKTTMKRLAAYLLAILLVIQIMPAIAGETYTATFTPGYVKYREILEITQVEETSILTEDMTNQLNVTAGYANVVWSSDNEAVATVDQTGLVTAKAPGQVRITVEAEGYSDSITFRIVAKPQTEKAEKNDNEPAEKIIIIINGEKTKVEYDGQVHENTYTATSNSDSFDTAKLKLTDAGKAHLGSGTDCGTYTDKLTADDFTYEGGEAEIVISKGWVQIKPKEITIKADDKTIAEGETPNYSATVTDGLLPGDSIDLSAMEYKITEEEGLSFIDPQIEVGQIIGNYRVRTVASGVLTIKRQITSPLYNLAQVAGEPAKNDKNWYRLKKTTIKTEKQLSEYVNQLKSDGNNKELTVSEYSVEPYDFYNEILTYKNKKYALLSRANDDSLQVDGYYTVILNTKEAVVAVKNKIGAGNAKTGEGYWLITEGRYDDPYKTSSFHRNYTITFYNKEQTLESQDLYNMLIVNGVGNTSNYYRLKRTSIKAIPIEDATVGAEMSKDQYALNKYDFSNLTLNIDGEEYKYSATAPEGEYESCYTVELQNVKRELRINQKLDWYNNESGWLDGAKEQYGDLGNETPGYHANYKATLYKGTKKENPIGVSITSNWPKGQPAYPGTRITLTAVLTGLEGRSYTLQWQYSKNLTDWTDVSGANDITYTYILSEETAQYSWRIVVRDVK